MCGRYDIIHSVKDIADKYEVSVPDFELKPRYNAAPTQMLPVIIEQAKREMELMRWGLIPNWAEDTKIGSKMINARSETLAEKPSFKKPLKSKRCLIPVDGFYEWKAIAGKGKQPMCFTVKDTEIFSLAGLWEIWDRPQEIIHSFTIITTEANELVSEVHDRMPVILDEENQYLWLSKKLSMEEHLELLKPFPSEKMSFKPVSKMLRFVDVDVPELLDEHYETTHSAKPKKLIKVKKSDTEKTDTLF